ncbi:MAG: efflux transporter outer membrane subunit [Desulfococcaceae bacterium]
MTKRLSIILGMLLFVSGCSFAPHYDRPAAPVPGQWPTGAAYGESSVSAQGTAADEIPWQDFFGDEKLKQVIETALMNNRDLRLAALNVEKAFAMYRIQRSEIYPSVSAGGSGTVQRVPADLSSGGKSDTKEQYSVSAGVTSWELDFFGRIRSLNDQAVEEYMATVEAQRSAQILLVSAVANTYLALAADREALKLAKSTLESQQEAYRLIKRRCEVGVAPELDLRRAQTQVDTARGDVFRYQQQTANDENALNLLMGAPAPAELLPEDLSGMTAPMELSAGISSEVLLLRPDIMAAEHRLKGANAQIGAARAALFPRIALTTTVGTASAELSGLFASGSGTWLFAPQITTPIFDARLWSAYDAAKVEREIAQTQYEKSIQTAFREVADALAAKGMADERLSAQQSLVEAVSETHRMATALYEKGMDSYLGVLDAQRSLYGAQQGLVMLRLSKFANYVKLYAVLGGGGA